jgi:hypothetical protein
MQNYCRHSKLMHLLVIALSFVLFQCGGGAESGEQVYERIRAGEQVDLNTLNCSQLEYLERKYKSIAESAARGAAGSSPAAAGSTLTAIQAHNALARVYSAKANNGC